MEKVLLAIDGMRPDQQLVDYAAKLCRRIKAELNILHVIDPSTYAGHLKNIQRQAYRARDMFENTMVAAAFAESGDFDTARRLADKASAQIHQLLSDTDRTDVKYRVQVKAGETEREILRHVNQNRNIVLTIYDGKFMTPGLRKKLSVPLVARRFNGQEQK